MLTIICPIYNEERYIAKLLESLIMQDYPKDDLEILLVDGMSNDGTRKIVSGYSARYPFFRLIDNPERVVPYALNRGIEAAKGDIIIILGAHASYQPDYFSVLVRGLRRLKVENVGTVCRTDVLNKTPKALAIREVLGNKFGVGNSTFRIGIDHAQEVETVPFGCYPREVFKKYGKFDVRLVRNQDIEFNKRIIRGGGKIYILPDTYCTYFARETWQSLAKNNYGNGKWIILTVFYTKMFSSLSIRHFVPLLFVLSLVIPLLLALFWWPFALISAASATAYILLMSIISVKLSIQNKLNICYLLITFAVLHLSYGWGSIVGILKLPFLANFGKKHSGNNL